MTTKRKTERPGPAFTKKRQRETIAPPTETTEDEATPTIRKIDPKDDPRLTMFAMVNLTLMNDHLLRKLTPIDTTLAYDHRTHEQQRRDAFDMRFEGKESKHRLHHAREARKQKVQRTWKLKRMQRDWPTESKESENNRRVVVHQRVNIVAKAERNDTDRKNEHPDDRPPRPTDTKRERRARRYAKARV